MTTTDAPKTTVTITITLDGKAIETEPGTLLIKAAQDAGVFIPRFCWHERMKPVGMCRMCLVEIEGVRGLPPACTTPVADGMVVHLQQENVEKVQDGVLEFLLINHPLDCPVCDRGGECPLQDQTLAFGPGESRFIEEKRHWEKPIPISDLVLLDRERCIQCARCTRFADEIAGDPLINFVERGDRTEVNTFPDEPFSSYFSGNTVQICPVGALTSSSYRFKARPWDLAQVETSCQTCAVGCRGALQSTANRLVRFLGVDSEPVNHGWLCDKGRYALDWVNDAERIREPQVRRDGALTPVSWPEALGAAATELRRVVDLHGPGAVAFIGGARGTNEGAYAWAKLAKGVLGTDNVDAQLGDGLPAEVVLGLPAAEIADLDTAAAVVLVAPDLKEELPVLFLRARRAAVELGVPVIDISARDHGLTAHAAAVLRHAPGAVAETVDDLARAIRGGSASEAATAAAALLDGRDGPVVVVLGRPSLAESPDAVVAAAATLRDLDRTRFLTAVRRANTRGALECGLTPGLLPGRVTLESGSDHFTGAWGAVPEARGLGTEGILRAAAAGEIHALVLLGADLLQDCPDRALAQAALAAVPYTVAVDAFSTAGNARADVFLPVTVWGENDGTSTNLEGRVQRLGQKVSPEGVPMPDWRIASELAFRLGHDFDWAGVDEVTDELAATAPSFAGADARLLLRARDGVVLPLADHEIEFLDAEQAPLITSSWDPIRPNLSARGVDPAQVLELTGDDAVDATVEAPAEADHDAVDAGDDGAEAGAGESSAGKTSAGESSAGAESAEGESGRDLFTWTDTPAVAAVPARDAYALRLVVGRKLYDHGRTAAASTNVVNLAGSPTLLVHRSDRDRIGVADGDTVRVTSARSTVTLPVRADGATPAGTAFLVFALDGLGAADLIDLAAPVTDLRVETLGS